MIFFLAVFRTLMDNTDQRALEKYSNRKQRKLADADRVQRWRRPWYGAAESSRGWLSAAHTHDRAPRSANRIQRDFSVSSIRFGWKRESQYKVWTARLECSECVPTIISTRLLAARALQHLDLLQFLIRMLLCPALSCPTLSCPALPSTALICTVLLSPALHCPALPCE